MDLRRHPPEDDVLAEPIRTQLFEALAELRRPATTPELAAQVGRHPNNVRLQLGRLETAGLVERRLERRARGRPRDTWAIAADARPGGGPPDAHHDLGRWLARAIGRHTPPEALEAAGREIGRELAPEPGGRPVAEGMHDALAALGFAPRAETAGDTLRFVLRNCPYRDAVATNQPAICSLHRGITQGLLERLGSDHRLAGFVPRDPFTAGCLIDIARAA